MNSSIITTFARRTIALFAFAIAFSLALPAVAEEAVEPAGQHRVDINSAGFEELMSVPGIGPALAERIIEARHQRPFRLPHELVRVKGIGQDTLQRLRPYITVESPASSG